MSESLNTVCGHVIKRLGSLDQRARLVHEVSPVIREHVLWTHDERAVRVRDFGETDHRQTDVRDRVTGCGCLSATADRGCSRG